MHYFPAWTEEFVLNMPYEKLVMYLRSIPEYETDEEGGQPASSKKEETKHVSLFDFATGNK